LRIGEFGDGMIVPFWHFQIFRLGLDVSCHLSLDEKTMGILWKASFFGTGTAIGPWW
jgi:hypothetical protein